MTIMTTLWRLGAAVILWAPAVLWAPVTAGYAYAVWPRYGTRAAWLAVAALTWTTAVFYLPGAWLGYGWAGQLAGLAAVTVVAPVVHRRLPLPRPDGTWPR